MRAVILLTAVFGCLAGCGGGGTPPAPINKLSGQTRQLQPGDSCSYSFNGTYTPTNGTATSVSGTAVNKVESRTGNQLTISHTVTTHLYDTVSTVVSSLVETQAVDGSTKLVSVTRGPSNVTLTVTGNTFDSPGLLKVPLSASGVVTYDNGETTTNTFEVTGTEAVNTALGLLNTFVVQAKSIDSAGYTSTTTSNLVPELGFAVKWSETDELAGVGIESVIFRIQSTTVPVVWS